MRQFVGTDLGCEPVPDETTVCKFRHLLEAHRSWTRPSCTHPLRPRTGSSSAIRRCTRRRRANNGFGMKAHVGVDSKTKIIHTAVATAANVADSVVLPDLLHGEETRVWGDQAYRGQTEVIRECAPQARDCTHRRYRYKNRIDEVERAKN